MNMIHHFHDPRRIMNTGKSRVAIAACIKVKDLR